MNTYRNHIKRNSIIRSISIALIIAVLTMVAGLKINESYNIKSINDADKKIEEHISSTVLNGYVSRADYTAGFLGGKVQYDISRVVGGRPVLFENKVQSFGINQTFIGMSG